MKFLILKKKNRLRVSSILQFNDSNNSQMTELEQINLFVCIISQVIHPKSPHQCNLKNIFRRESSKMYELYSKYWRHLAAWAGDSLIKQSVTVLGIPLIIQLTLGTFFTLADLGKWREIPLSLKILFKRDI